MAKNALDVLLEVVTLLDLPGGFETVETLSLGRSLADGDATKHYNRLISTIRENQQSVERVRLDIAFQHQHEGKDTLLETAIKLVSEMDSNSVPTDTMLLCGEK